MPIDDLTQAALSLPEDLRFQLVEELLDSFVSDVDKSIQAEWLVEARMRRDEIRNGLVQPIPGDEALVQVRQLFG